LRFGDHNVLVAECKFWEGISSFKKALGQLEGYLTLRDTHAALIVFVRGKDVHTPAVEAEAFVATLPGAEKLKAAELLSTGESRRVIGVIDAMAEGVVA
jgi:hypothetical protein